MCHVWLYVITYFYFAACFLSILFYHSYLSTYSCTVSQRFLPLRPGPRVPATAVTAFNCC